jgi:hypothetical protein
LLLYNKVSKPLQIEPADSDDEESREESEEYNGFNELRTSDKQPAESMLRSV